MSFAAAWRRNSQHQLACSAALRGDLLLMNLNGDDSKYSCELHHGLHSWVGAATDGGYLGKSSGVTREKKTFLEMADFWRCLESGDYNFPVSCRSASY